MSGRACSANEYWQRQAVDTKKNKLLCDCPENSFIFFHNQVQADVAAIAMEEVMPSSVADAEALAPEEIYAKKRGRDADFLEGDGGTAACHIALGALVLSRII